MNCQEIISKMTLEEKIALLCGSVTDSMNTEGCERLGVRAQHLADGPLGVRVAEHPEENCTCFPCEASMASTWNKDLIQEVGDAIADDCINHGKDMILGPGVNIKRTPLCGRNFEYFSEDPVLSGKIAAAYIRGVENKNIGTSVKHYAANNQETDRSFVSVDIDERTLREIYLRSFEIAIKEGKPSSIMTAHNRINGLKCSENPKILKDILRDEWGFEGITLTDWNDVKYGPTSLISGIDLGMPYKASMRDEILEGLQKKVICEADIDNAIGKLIAFSMRDKHPDIVFDRDHTHDVARRTAEEGIVLLKNQDGVLPITPQKYKKIVVIGEYAEDPVYFGLGSSRVFPREDYVDTPLESLKRLLGDQIEVEYIKAYPSIMLPSLVYSKGSIYDFIPNKDVNEEGRKIHEADLVIMFLGNQFGVETEDADRRSALLDTYYNSYISRVRYNNENIVLVLQTGSAVVPHLWDESAKAVVEMWYAGEAGGSALANILCGVSSPSGKLSETFPRRERKDIDYPGDGYKVCYDEKWAVGYRYYDLHPEEIAYPFGFGLSYTEFAYSNLNITDLGERLKIDFDVTNTGAVAGKEACQIYVADEISFVSKPKKELVEFYKTKELKPQEQEHVTVEFSKEYLGYYSTNLRKIFIEPGTYKILVGSSSRDIRLSGEYQHPNVEPHYFMQPNGYTIVG